MEEHIWTGATGTKYKHTIFSINFIFNPNQDVNFIFCKIVNNHWKPLYLGEGDLKGRVEFRRNEGCVIRKGATHVHAHLNNSNRDRSRKEEDTFSSYPDSYQFTGCNEKKRRRIN